jgi:hypothetical protein
MPASPSCSAPGTAAAAAWVLLLDDAVADVGAVEAADELARVLQLQPLDDVGAREVVGGGGERDARHAGVALVQHRQAAVLGPEVVAPLADAVRLVDGEQGQPAAIAQAIQQVQEPGRGHALGRRVEQGDLAARQPPLDVLRLLEGERRIEERCLDAGLVQRAHLVVHQRDERRHHHADALPGALARDGRHLVAQRLAAAGGHEHERVAAGDDVLDDLGLRAAEVLVAEHFVEDGTA